MLREASLILLGASIHKAITFITHSLNRNQAVVFDDSSNDDESLSQRVSAPTSKYDVFLSFRGEDTRHTFASYLYKGLCNAGILTFMDHDLHKGEQISPVLLKTIEESDISVIIFSENYASSTWCMDELIHILECQKKFGRVVIPIFYNVDPSNIRKLVGSFGSGFEVLKRRFKGNQEKLQKWRDALVQSTSLCGWGSNNTRPEYKFVEEIIKDILRKLDHKSSSHHERLVGIAYHIENVENLLNEASILGIWGMGGAGKTTLAKALLQKLKSQFDAFSFIENVREKLARSSLDELQKNCLQELLKDGDINIYDINSVQRRLQRKKILLILDDVDNAIIVDDLIRVGASFGDGSRIVITSRDEQVLKNAAAYSTYHVSKLDFHDAFCLFSLKAFKQHEPYEGYMGLSKSVVEYCGGNPLALVVLGCSLYGRGKEEWESALEKLNQAPPKNIVDVLKVTFDGLDDKQQNILLDLAFLIREGVCISLDLIRQLYGSSGYIEISVLKEKSLISLDNHTGDIWMHNLLREMGLEIAIQQLYSSSRTPVRLWRHEDADSFSNCDKGVDSIRCLSLDLSKINRTAWWAINFGKMHNLILLKVYKSNWRRPSELTICGDLDYLPEKLRFFSWEECPLSQVPLHFCSENLIELRMRHSNIRQLWIGNQHFPNLKKIDVGDSKHLTTLPDLSQAPKIEIVGAAWCVNLDQIHASTTPNNLRLLAARRHEPRRINLNSGGSMKGTRSRLVIGFNYLDPNGLAFHKIRIKLLVCGNIICGVRFKHVQMTLEGRYAVELKNLLPFATIVRCLLEAPTEYWHDFMQHYDYNYDRDCCFYNSYSDLSVMLTVMNRRGERGERHMIMKDHNEEEKEVVAKPTLMEVEQNEEDEEVMIEYPWTNNIFIKRFPQSITRWLLLKQLTLRESDIMIVEDSSILKSLFPFSHTSCNTVLDTTISLHIPPSTFTHSHHQSYFMTWFQFQLLSDFIYYEYEYGHPTDRRAVLDIYL